MGKVIYCVTRLHGGPEVSFVHIICSDVIFLSELNKIIKKLDKRLPNSKVVKKTDPELSPLPQPVNSPSWAVRGTQTPETPRLVFQMYIW